MYVSKTIKKAIRIRGESRGRVCRGAHPPPPLPPAEMKPSSPYSFQKFVLPHQSVVCHYLEVHSLLEKILNLLKWREGRGRGRGSVGD